MLVDFCTGDQPDMPDSTQIDPSQYPNADLANLQSISSDEVRHHATLAYA